VWGYNKKVYTLFVGFRKAYDSIHWTSLLNILKDLNFSKKLIYFIKIRNENTEIKIPSSTSQPFKVFNGMRQSGAFS